MQDSSSYVSTQSPTLGARLMEPRFGFDVYKISVKLFEKHPLQIFLLGLLYLLFVFISAVTHPVVEFALALITPIVAIGLLRTFRLMDSTSEKISFSQLKDNFFDPSRRQDYIVLGVINLAYELVATALGSGGVLGWVELVIGVLYQAAIFFAYPLIEFDRIKPLDAIKASLQIVKLNWKAAIIYNLATIVFLVLSLCALGVGFFIFFPLMLITHYVAYKIVLNK